MRINQNLQNLVFDDLGALRAERHAVVTSFWPTASGASPSKRVAASLSIVLLIFSIIQGCIHG
jgi:hypothetical protein